MSGGPELHPLLEAAGQEGRFPDWARIAPERREHAARVRELLGAWADDLELDERDRVRFRAAGTLHDALRDAGEEELRPWVDADLATPLLHGSACAGRLREEGVEDEELLQAITHHTTGHPDLSALGEFLYLADYLEPGREFLSEARQRIRLLLPLQREEALRSVVALRIAHRLEVRGELHPSTIELWNRLVA